MLILKTTAWVSKSFTSTRKVIQCLHKTLPGIIPGNINLNLPKITFKY